MIKSMTGFGRARETVENMEILFEIKSVNNRYLDVSVRCPRIYGFLEERIKKEVGAVISRGKVDVFLSADITDDSSLRVQLNRGLLESYLEAFAVLRRDYALRDDLSVSSVCRLPDVFRSKAEEEDAEEVIRKVMVAARRALLDYDRMRQTEGERLYEDLRAKADQVGALVEQIRELSPRSVQAYEARLRAKVGELLSDARFDEARILTEVVLFADRVAIDEEITRLQSHLFQFSQTLELCGPTGRKLDFLLQEINREINTVGSKCSELEISRLVIDAKSELEKIREQIQNIE